MSLSEDQLRKDLASSPDDWPKRLKLVERLADRWAGQEMDMLLTASPNAPATEAEMRRVVDLANAHCPGYRGLKHVLGLFLEAHLTSSWAHFIQAQAQLHSGEEEAALRHYQTSRSLNPARSDPELEQLLARRGVPAVSASAPAAAEPAAEPAVVTPVPPKRDPLLDEPEPEPESQSDAGEEVPAEADGSALEQDFPSEPEAEKVADAEQGSVTGDEDTAGDSDPPGESEKETRADPESESDDRESEDTGTKEAESDSETGRAEDDDARAEKEKGSIGEKAATATASGERAADFDDPDCPFHTESLAEDGEVLTAAKKEDDSRERLSAFSIALILHVVLLIVFAFWQVVKPRPDPPMFVSSVVSTGEEAKPKRPEVKRYQRPRMPSPTARMNVMTAPAISDIPMPEMNRSVSTFDPVGSADDFGPSMSFGGGGGGSVSFFGSKSKSKRVVFVVDVSASMGGSKDLLMRKELTKSIGALPPTIEYALIFFGGPAWYAGQKVGEAGLEGQWIANVVQDGSRRYVWYEGWSERERHDGTRTSALYHYSLGPQNLPSGPYQKATRTNIRQTVQQIEQTPLIFGTDWRWPLMMAMNMKPDTIFFMTDGAFGTGRGVSKEEMIEGLLEHNRKTGNARINTVCMMVLQARQELERLARGSNGEFTLVKSDGTVVRGKDLDNE